MNTKEFSIQDVSVFRNDEDVDFAIVNLRFLSDGNNAQNCPISTEVLKRDAKTVLGKPIVAKFHKFQNDVGTHELDEVIIGYIPHNAEIKFEYDETYGKTFAVVQGVISKIYATEVYNLFIESNERAVSSEFSCIQDNPNECGEGEITSYMIHGITVLGKNVRPAVAGAKIEVKRFSSNDVDEFYDSINNKLKKFANNRKNKFNKQTKQFDKENKNLDKEATMEEEKLLAESMSVVEEEKDVVMEAEETMAENNEVVEQEESKEMSEETTEEMSCGKKMAEDENEEAENEKDVDEEENDEAEEEKKFSLDAYVDESFYLAMLEKETESNKEFVERVFTAMSAEDIVTTILEFARENAELKAFKEERLAIDKEVKLNAIMSNVKEDLDEKTFAELKAEGEVLDFAELGAFENKVKAFAYEATKGKVKEQDNEEVMKFALPETKETIVEKDVFDKYL